MINLGAGCLILGSLLFDQTIEERTRLKMEGPDREIRFGEWVSGQDLVVEGALPKNLFIAPQGASENLWKQLDRAANTAGGHWRFGTHSLRFSRGPVQWQDYFGSFGRGQLESVQAERSFEEGGGKLQFRLGLAWHPRLCPVLVQAGSFGLEFDQPGGLKGKSQTKPTSWIPVDQGFHASLELNGDSLPRSVQKLNRFQGEVRLVVPEQVAWLNLGPTLLKMESNPATDPKRQVGKTWVRRLGHKVSSNRISLEVEIHPGPSSFPLETYQESALIGPARIQSESGGVPVFADGYTTLQNENGGIRIRYDWLRKENQPLEELTKGTIEVRLGDNLVEKQGKLDFRDIPLP